MFTGDIESNTVLPGMDVLRDKHPVMRTQDLAEPECSSFEEYEEDPDVFPLDILEEDVMWFSGKLSGAAGPSGTDLMEFQIWLLRFV